MVCQTCREELMNQRFKISTIEMLLYWEEPTRRVVRVASDFPTRHEPAGAVDGVIGRHALAVRTNAQSPARAVLRAHLVRYAIRSCLAWSRLNLQRQNLLQSQCSNQNPIPYLNRFRSLYSEKVVVVGLAAPQEQGLRVARLIEGSFEPVVLVRPSEMTAPCPQP